MVYAKKKTINCKYVKIKYSKIRRAKLLIFLEKDKKVLKNKNNFLVPQFQIQTNRESEINHYNYTSTKKNLVQGR